MYMYMYISAYYLMSNVRFYQYLCIHTHIPLHCWFNVSSEELREGDRDRKNGQKRGEERGKEALRKEMK